MKGWLEIYQLQDFDSSKSVLARGGVDYREERQQQSNRQGAKSTVSWILQSCKHLLYGSKCKMALDICLKFCIMRNKLKRIGHIMELWCCLSSQLGPSIQLTKQRLSLGAALHTAAAGANAGQQGPRTACASAALRKEGKLGQILVGVLCIKGQGKSTTSGVLDRCHQWLCSKVSFYNHFHTFGPAQYNQGCDAPQSLLLPGCSSLVYYHLYRALCQTLQTKHRASLQKWVEDAEPLYLSKMSTPTSSSHMCSSACCISPAQLCQAPCTEAQGIYQKHSQANTHTNITLPGGR